MLRFILLASLACVACGKKSNPSSRNGSAYETGSAAITGTAMPSADAASDAAAPSMTGSDGSNAMGSGSTTSPQPER